MTIQNPWPGEPKKLACRDYSGQVLLDLARRDERVWGLTPDTGASLANYAAEFPDRYVDVGIAEQCVVGVAAGLALEGAMPFIAGMSPFLSMRAFEQIRTDVCYQGLPVRFICWNGGLTTGGGPTHNAMEDLALMKSIVNLTVVSIADPNMMAAIMRRSLDLDGPLYIRFGTGKGEACIYDPETLTGEVGSGLIARPGTDVSIIAHGDLVHEALAAAELLAAQGVSAQVVDLFTIKPLDTDLIARCVETTGHLVVVEDHLSHGGLASSIADALIDLDCRPKSFRRLGVPQRYTGFGPAPVQWHKYGYDRSGIVRTVQEVLGTGPGG